MQNITVYSKSGFITTRVSDGVEVFDPQAKDLPSNFRSTKPQCQPIGAWEDGVVKATLEMTRRVIYQEQTAQLSEEGSSEA